ncbi:MAG: NAD(P)-dependent oxidoreductase [Planctomycetes bacterium]|nr:NAD(P)-dependent oxidoreductase [Planctomycetota bacterium]
MAAKKKILITGPGGRVGKWTLKPLMERFDVRVYDLRKLPEDPDGVVGDLQDLNVLRQAMAGREAVLHLAATSDEAPFVEQLVPNNVVGVYNVFEAAVQAGVKRVVFASTVQTMQAASTQEFVKVSDPVRPCTRYGATKVFGEALGRYYFEKHKLEVVAIRIGWFAGYDDPALKKDRVCRKCWLSPRDAVGLFSAAMEKPSVGFGVVIGTSVCDDPWFSRTEMKDVLGFEPQDDVVKLYGKLPSS